MCVLAAVNIFYIRGHICKELFQSFPRFALGRNLSDGEMYKISGLD